MNCVAPRCPTPAAIGAVFCDTHLQATPAQRGGWLSAHRRRMVRANSVDETLDASNIARRLWVGARPPVDRHLPEFDTLVLCAEEIQPQVIAFRGHVVRCPLPDADLTRRQLAVTLSTGRTVADALAKGSTVLVTCAQGRNRSALVAMLGLGLVTRLTVHELILLVRQRRDPECLSNPVFRAILHRYIGENRALRAPKETVR